MTMDANGDLYFADWAANCIRKISAWGIITTVAGNGSSGYSGDGGLAANATLNHPSGVAVDARGDVYIADGGNQRVRKVSAGIITTVAGNGSFGYSGDGGPATAAQLASPQGVAVDADANLYIADELNARIRKVSGDGSITTVAGDGSAGYSGDGSRATAAQLWGPMGIAVGTGGNLYIADFMNDAIRLLRQSPSRLIDCRRGVPGPGRPRIVCPLGMSAEAGNGEK
jgi:sugar lactone lactonase YvrE